MIADLPSPHPCDIRIVTCFIALLAFTVSSATLLSTFVIETRFRDQSSIVIDSTVVIVTSVLVIVGVEKQKSSLIRPFATYLYGLNILICAVIYGATIFKQEEFFWIFTDLSLFRLYTDPDMDPEVMNFIVIAVELGLMVAARIISICCDEMEETEKQSFDDA